jgi:hypothetical protein
MNIPAPPETGDIEDIREWLNELYKWIQFPHVNQIRFVPRSAAPTGDGAAGGVTYYDSDDDKLKCHNDTAFQDTY